MKKIIIAILIVLSSNTVLGSDDFLLDNDEFQEIIQVAKQAYYDFSWNFEISETRDFFDLNSLECIVTPSNKAIEEIWKSISSGIFHLGFDENDFPITEFLNKLENLMNKPTVLKCVDDTNGADKYFYSLLDENYTIILEFSSR